MDTRFHSDNSGKGNLIVQNVQDCTPIAEMCKRLQSQGKTGSSDMKFVGTIPAIMVEKYCIDNNVTYKDFIRNDDHVKRIMNDPAMSHFRVWKGKL